MANRTTTSASSNPAGWPATPLVLTGLGWAWQQYLSAGPYATYPSTYMQAIVQGPGGFSGSVQLRFWLVDVNQNQTPPLTDPVVTLHGTYDFVIDTTFGYERWIVNFPIDWTQQGTGDGYHWQQAFYIEVVVDGTVVLTQGGSAITGDEYWDNIGYGEVSPLSCPEGSHTAFFRYDTLASQYEGEPTYENSIRLRDPDKEAIVYPDDIVRGWTWFFIDWGDGNRTSFENGNDLSGTLTDGVDRTTADPPNYPLSLAMSHTYQNPGTYNIQLWAGYWETGETYRGSIGGPPMARTIDELRLRTLIAEQTFVAGHRTVATTPMTTYTADVIDRHRNTKVHYDDDKNPATADKPFGEDHLLMSVPFSTLRANNVAAAPGSGQIVGGFTFHTPWADGKDDWYDGYASALVPVDDDVILRRYLRDRATFSNHYAAGRYEHGNGPTPDWTLTGSAETNLIGQRSDEPYYLLGYLIGLGVGVASHYVSGGVGVDRQNLVTFNAATGAAVGGLPCPLLPDQETGGSSFDLPEAWRTLGDTAVVWAANSGLYWIHDHATGDAWPLFNLMTLMQGSDEDMTLPGSVFDRTTRGVDVPWGNGRRPIVLNATNDGGLTLAVQARPPGESHYQWWAIGVDGRGRYRGALVPLNLTAAYPSDWATAGSTADAYGNLVADPETGDPYVMVTGTPAAFDPFYAEEQALYRVSISTGVVTRVGWFSHPWQSWNFNPATGVPVGDGLHDTDGSPVWSSGFQALSNGDNWDQRWLDFYAAAAATRMPAGTFKLRPPPGVFYPIAGALAFRGKDDGSYWTVANTAPTDDDPIGALMYIADGSVQDSYPLDVGLQPGDVVRVLANRDLIAVYLNGVAALTIHDSRNIDADQHGIGAATGGAKLDDFSVSGSGRLAFVARDVNVRFVPNA